jgi:hypothetical protein
VGLLDLEDGHKRCLMLDVPWSLLYLNTFYLYR